MTGSEGGCLCGAVRYRITAPLDDVLHCHCSMCRRSTGGIVVTWVTIDQSTFSWTIGAANVYESSAGCRRYFCGRCGAQMAFIDSGRRPMQVDVTVATLDHPEPCPAKRHCWTTDAIKWLSIDPQLPQHDDAECLQSLTDPSK